MLGLFYRANQLLGSPLEPDMYYNDAVSRDSPARPPGPYDMCVAWSCARAAALITDGVVFSGLCLATCQVNKYVNMKEDYQRWSYWKPEHARYV